MKTSAKISRLVLWFLAVSFASSISLAAPYPSKTENILYGLPGTKGTILYRKGYVLAYDNVKKVASWSLACLPTGTAIPKEKTSTR
jgi:hypothetical protein